MSNKQSNHPALAGDYYHTILAGCSDGSVFVRVDHEGDRACTETKWMSISRFHEMCLFDDDEFEPDPVNEQLSEIGRILIPAAEWYPPHYFAPRELIFVLVQPTPDAGLLLAFLTRDDATLAIVVGEGDAAVPCSSFYRLSRPFSLTEVMTYYPAGEQAGDGGDQ